MSKFLTLVAIFGLSAKAVNAQVAKGATLIGGQVLYYNSDIDFSTTQPNQKQQTATFNISSGKAYKQNSVVGVNLSYSPMTAKNDYNGSTFVNTKAQHYSLGILQRQYRQLAKDFYFFVETGASYVASKQTNTDTTGTKLLEVKESGAQLTLTPGISYRIYKKVHLEILIPYLLSLQYDVTTEKTQSLTSKQKQFQGNTSLNSNPIIFLAVGFHFVL